MDEIKDKPVQTPIAFEFQNSNFHYENGLKATEFLNHHLKTRDMSSYQNAHLVILLREEALFYLTNLLYFRSL